MERIDEAWDTQESSRRGAGQVRRAGAQRCHFPGSPAAWHRCAPARLTCPAPRREDSCVSHASSIRSIIRPPPQRDATSVDPITNTKRFASLSQESLSCNSPAIAHTRKNDLLEVATTLRSMMQYGGELVRRICSSK